MGEGTSGKTVLEKRKSLPWNAYKGGMIRNTKDLLPGGGKEDRSFTEEKRGTGHSAPFSFVNKEKNPTVTARNKADHCL